MDGGILLADMTVDACSEKSLLAANDVQLWKFKTREVRESLLTGSSLRLPVS
jgi:hypothetical protein